jgi:trehalose-6-phosphatase
MIDFDGTLSPPHAERGRGAPDRRQREALRAVALMGEPLVVLSSLPVDSLHELLRGIPAHLVGEHGWEELMLTGTRRAHTLPRNTAARLGLAHRAAIACGWRAHLEATRASVVFHARGLPADRVEPSIQHCRELWGRYFERDGLRMQPIEGGVALRAGHRGKSMSAWECLRQEPEGTLPVYLGGDGGDEQSFRVLRSLGVTIRVGRPHMPSAAEWRLGGGDDVAAFLEHWRRVVPRPVG